MSKKIHPVDAWVAKQLAQATGYIVCFHFGREGGHITRSAPTIEHAKAVAAEWDWTYGQNGRRAMIYAALPGGRTHPVGEGYVNPAKRKKGA